MNKTQTQPVGRLLRSWRERRRMSQLGLAVEAEISARHLSFLETGRATPSRQMLLRLAEQLAIPLREQNALLSAAGYAPVFPERPLAAPELQAAQQAIELVLRGHEPFPALAIDRHWTLVASNRAIPPLLAGADPSLMEPPVNVLRLSLHPLGLTPRIANYAAWRAHLLARLRQQIELSADEVLSELLQELATYPVPPAVGQQGHPLSPSAALVVPLQLHSGEGLLSFISTTTVFGTPIDVTISELAIESFFPADAATGAAMRSLMLPSLDAGDCTTATQRTQ